MSRALWAEGPKMVLLGGPRVGGQPWRRGQGWAVCLERTELLGDEALRAAGLIPGRAGWQHRLGHAGAGEPVKVVEQRKG